MQRLCKQVECLHTEDLIREVKKYPAIWDPTQEDYINKVEREKAWVSIMVEFFPDIHDRSVSERKLIEMAIRKRWKSIRTCYAREILKLKTQKGPAATGRRQYLHFGLLRFLDSPSKPASASALEENQDIPNNEEPAQTSSGSKTPAPVLTQEAHPPQPPLLKSCTITSQSTAIRKRNTDESYVTVIPKRKKLMQPETPVTENRNWMCEQEADKMFLLSLVPDFQKVSDDRKLQLKSDIIIAILKAQKAPTSDTHFQSNEEWSGNPPTTGGCMQNIVEYYQPSTSSAFRSQDGIACHQEIDVSPEKTTFIKIEPSASISSIEDRDTLAESGDDEELFSF